MNKENREFKFELQSKGYTYLMVANALGISETSVYRLFRKELSDEKKQEIRECLERVKNG